MAEHGLKFKIGVLNIIRPVEESTLERIIQKLRIIGQTNQVQNNFYCWLQSLFIRLFIFLYDLASNWRFFALFSPILEIIYFTCCLYLFFSICSSSSQCQPQSSRANTSYSIDIFETIIAILLIIFMLINSTSWYKITKLNNPLFYCFSQSSQKKYFFNIQPAQKKGTSLVYPKQYPTNLADTSPMIPRGRPVRFLTPRDQIPQMRMMPNDDVVIKTVYNNEWKSPANAFKLNVGLIGPINSGKSQLLSKLSHKVGAVSPKRNTTDEILHAFKSLQIQGEEGIKNVQLKYFDTPGLTYNKTGFTSKGWTVLSQIDFSLLIIDSSKKFDDLLQESIKRLEKHRNYQNFMKALVLNKIDLVQNKRKFQGLISQIQKYGKFDKIFYTSALTGYGIEQIQKYLLGMAKPGQWEHPKQSKTDSTELQIYEQMLKQALFHRTYNQVPYSTVIQCESIASKSNGTDFVQFRVLVQDQNVQRMVIGTKGRNINWVRDYFKTSYTKTFAREVQVHVRVVIRKKTLMRSTEGLQSDYQNYRVNKELDFMNQELAKEGKLIK